MKRQGMGDGMLAGLRRDYILDPARRREQSADDRIARPA